MKILRICIALSLSLSLLGQVLGQSKSFYPLRLEDSEATYFTPEQFKITNDGKTDVSDELQRAINEVKTSFNVSARLTAYLLCDPAS